MFANVPSVRLAGRPSQDSVSLSVFGSVAAPPGWRDEVTATRSAVSYVVSLAMGPGEQTIDWPLGMMLEARRGEAAGSGVVEAIAVLRVACAS